MKPRRDQLIPHLAGVDEAFLDAHLTRLGEDYYAEFAVPEVVRHVRELSRLSADRPVAVLVEEDAAAAAGDADSLVCTILAADHAGLFSLITGVLAAAGFTIDAGAAYTYGPAGGSTPRPSRPGEARLGGRRPGQRRARRPLRPPPAARRAMIVNRFRGRRVAAHARAMSVAAWRQHAERLLAEVAADLEGGAPEAARRRVSELVADAIRGQWERPPELAPVHIDIANLESSPAALRTDGSGAVTRMRIVAEDTPLFLYSLSAALALHGVVILRVTIRTVAGRVEDTIDVVDRWRRPIADPALVDRLKLSILLTKQFAYFVGAAPDPYAALGRFEQLTEQIAELPAKGQLVDVLADPAVMGDLALLLGSSDYLWEDFIRRQYETLLPMLQGERRDHLSDTATIGQRLRDSVRAAATAEQQVAALNAFKDREAYLIDLEHILHPESDVARLAERLTRLAECVVECALQLAAEALRPRFGVARTLGGIDTRVAVMGLGKLGGSALGYASDIELMFVFSDHGSTTGPERIGNADYYERLVQETVHRISAKRAGIFEVDLRLRPFGDAGPRGVSLESFTDYYGPGGAALAYERLALIRMRTVAGDRVLGARLERLRDELVYRTGAIPLADVHAMRRRQLAEHGSGERINAKFSAGALVDVEYAVQMLQVRHGDTHAALRTSSVHRALQALAGEQILDSAEAGQVLGAYDFYRRLINALRSLRGSALDLHLPAAGAVECSHLARRMGYRGTADLTPAQLLYLELEQRREQVRRFIDARLGHGVLGSGSIGGIADIVLSLDDTAEPPAEAAVVFGRMGFAHPERALANLVRLVRRAPDRSEFARLAVLAADQLAVQSDPDRALNNWERYAAAVDDPEHHFQLMLLQPTRLDLLVRIFATSQFLSDALVRTPDLFDWVTDPSRLRQRRRLQDVVRDLDTGGDWLARIDAVRRREILRIAIRDYCLRAPATDVMHELSVVAEALIGAALDQLTADRPEVRARACILAFGKLGGGELNYSSDIDLVALYDDRGLPEARRADLARAVTHLARSLDRALSASADEMAAYRVDWRLRPYGGSGELAHSLSSLAAYYDGPANDWEVQALLRLRPVAGNRAAGSELLARARRAFARFGADPAARGARVFATIERLRELAVVEHGRSQLRRGQDIKSGVGGIRDVEFLIQGLQIQHLARHPELLCGNTVTAIERLQRLAILTPHAADLLREDYLFLRSLEHFLQVFEDRQVHVLPSAPATLDALARRMLGTGAGSAQFQRAVAAVTERVRATYLRVVREARSPAPSGGGAPEQAAPNAAGG